MIFQNKLNFLNIINPFISLTTHLMFISHSAISKSKERVVPFYSDLIYKCITEGAQVVQIQNYFLYYHTTKIKLTFGDADDTVGRECGLVVIDVHNVYANCGSSCELRHAFVCSNYRQTVHVSDFSIKHNVGFYKSREWRLNYEGIVVVSVYYVI